MRAVIAAALLLAAGPVQGAPAADACAAAPAATPVQLYRAGAFLTAHHLALTLRTLCPRAPAAPQWGLVSALSLVKLDDGARAAALLGELQAADPGDSRPAVALAWLHLGNRDQQAFAAAVARLPPQAAARLQALAAADADAPDGAFARRASGLPAPLPPLAARAHAALVAARHDRRPWLAGSFSAVLPGAGQAYAGSWQSAAVAFALNAVWLGASVELVRHRLYFTGAAAGLVTSVFYVGNIANAVDLARRRNQALAREPRERLEQLLVPEVFPEPQEATER